MSSGSKREGVAAASAVTAAARALEDLGSQLLAIETENHVRKETSFSRLHTSTGFCLFVCFKILRVAKSIRRSCSRK